MYKNVHAHVHIYTHTCMQTYTHRGGDVINERSSSMRKVSKPGQTVSDPVYGQPVRPLVYKIAI